MVRALVPAHFVDDLANGAAALGVELVPYDPHGAPLADSTGAEILFRWWISAEEGDRLIAAHPLRWIHTGSAGVDHLITPALHASGAILTNAAGVHAPSIAEWTVASILAMEKKLPEMIERQKKHLFEKIMTDELAGKRIVILGAGAIARAIAVRLRPFGVVLRTIRRRGDPLPEFDEVRTVDDLADAVSDADWLIVTAPLTPATHHLISRDVIARLPRRCRVVNVSRGEVVDEEALLAALREKRVAGAVLDVFREEPLPPDHQFWSMPDVLVLPHTTWRSPLVRRREAALFLDNLGRFVRGEPLLNVVNLDEGY